jgi:hypothetical protein
MPDASVRGKSGDNWVVEFRILREETNFKGELPGPPESPSEEAELRGGMAPLLQEALGQIRQERAQLFERVGGSLFQVPVVAASHTFVLAQRVEVKREPPQPPAPERLKGSPRAD